MVAGPADAATHARAAGAGRTAVSRGRIAGESSLPPRLKKGPVARANTSRHVATLQLEFHRNQADRLHTAAVLHGGPEAPLRQHLLLRRRIEQTMPAAALDLHVDR